MNKELFKLNKIWWKNPDYTQTEMQQLVNNGIIHEVDYLEHTNVYVYGNDSLYFIVVSKQLPKPFEPVSMVKCVLKDVTATTELYEYINGQEPLYMKGMLSRAVYKHVDVVLAFKR